MSKKARSKQVWNILRKPHFWAETFFSNSSRKHSPGFMNMLKISERLGHIGSFHLGKTWWPHDKLIVFFFRYTIWPQQSNRATVDLKKCVTIFYEEIVKEKMCNNFYKGRKKCVRTFVRNSLRKKSVTAFIMNSLRKEMCNNFCKEILKEKNV